MLLKNIWVLFSSPFHGFPLFFPFPSFSVFFLRDMHSRSKFHWSGLPSVKKTALHQPVILSCFWSSHMIGFAYLGVRSMCTQNYIFEVCHVLKCWKDPKHTVSKKTIQNHTINNHGFGTSSWITKSDFFSLAFDDTFR